MSSTHIKPNKKQTDLRLEDYKDLPWKDSHDTTSKTGTHRYVIQITDECNLECEYCFQLFKRRPGVIEDSMVKEFIDKAVVDFENRPTQGAIFFQIIGGELFLYPDKVRTILEHIVDIGLAEKPYKLIVTCVSNGTLITDDIVDLFKKYTFAHPNISIDGDESTHDAKRGCWSTIVGNIHKLKDAGVHTNIAMTITPDTVHNLAHSYAFLQHEFQDVRSIWLSLTLGDSRWEEDRYAEEVYKQMCLIADFAIEHNTWCNFFDHIQYRNVPPHLCLCPTCHNQITVSPTGDLLPCYVARDRGVDISIGDVHNWVDPDKQAKFRNWNMLTEDSYAKDCISCPISQGCKRCIGDIITETGELRGSDQKHCKVQHAKFFAYQYLMQLRGALLKSGGYKYADRYNINSQPSSKT